MCRQRRVSFAGCGGHVAVAAVAISAGSAAAQTVILSLQNASAWREPEFCLGGTSMVACDAGCGWSGSASGGNVRMSGSISQAGTACSRWTFYASGPMSGPLARGQQLRVTYDLRPVVVDSTARMAYFSLAGSRGGGDIVAAGAGPTVMSGSMPLVGEIVTPAFTTPGLGGMGTWNVELEVEWTPGNGAPAFSLTIPVNGIVVEVIPRPACPADVDGDGVVTPADVSMFVNRWFLSLSNATLGGDFDGNGLVQPADIAAFVGAWLGAVTSGC